MAPGRRRKEAEAFASSGLPVQQNVIDFFRRMKAVNLKRKFVLRITEPGVAGYRRKQRFVPMPDNETALFLIMQTGSHVEIFSRRPVVKVNSFKEIAYKSKSHRYDMKTFAVPADIKPMGFARTTDLVESRREMANEAKDLRELQAKLSELTGKFQEEHNRAQTAIARADRIEEKARKTLLAIPEFLRPLNA